MKMLCFMLKHLDMENLPAILIAPLAGRHDIYGIEKKHYKVFSKAVSKAMIECINIDPGNQLAEDIAMAWQLFVNYFANVMCSTAKMIKKGFCGPLLREKCFGYWSQVWVKMTLDTVFIYDDKEYANMRGRFSLHSVDSIVFEHDLSADYQFSLVSANPYFALRLCANSEDEFSSWVSELEWRISALKRFKKFSKSASPIVAPRSRSNKLKKAVSEISSRTTIITHKNSHTKYHLIKESFDQIRNLTVKKDLSISSPVNHLNVHQSSASPTPDGSPRSGGSPRANSSPRTGKSSSRNSSPRPKQKTPETSPRSGSLARSGNSPRHPTPPRASRNLYKMIDSMFERFFKTRPVTQYLYNNYSLFTNFEEEEVSENNFVVVFSKMLSLIVGCLDNPDELLHHIQRLGVTHAIYGVTSDLYSTFIDVFTDIVEQTLAFRYQMDELHQLRENWTNLLVEISDGMVASGIKAQSEGVSAIFCRRIIKKQTWKKCFVTYSLDTMFIYKDDKMSKLSYSYPLREVVQIELLSQSANFQPPAPFNYVITIYFSTEGSEQRQQHAVTLACESSIFLYSWLQNIVTRILALLRILPDMNYLSPLRLSKSKTPEELSTYAMNQILCMLSSLDKKFLQYNNKATDMEDYVIQHKTGNKRRWSMTPNKSAPLGSSSPLIGQQKKSPSIGIKRFSPQIDIKHIGSISGGGVSIAGVGVGAGAGLGGSTPLKKQIRKRSQDIKS
eukprot:TRINITY_DN6446_c0_g2_i4.p1 TRINITY_DN6446_c0_g2~~TRINITY_DN6446_c0_g2_i4.p1  ORF type:complete len:729 (+),score=150.83 TRINITY_DN6446_c0_g2_i4:751-2937(+)